MRGELKERDIEAIAEIDLRFHGLIVELSGLTLLRHIWTSLDGLVRLRSYQALDRPGRAAQYFLKDAASSHIELVAALRSGDPARPPKPPASTSSRSDDARRPWRRARGSSTSGEGRHAEAPEDGA